jgi:hypothetical protein
MGREWWRNLALALTTATVILVFAAPLGMVTIRIDLPPAAIAEAGARAQPSFGLSLTPSPRNLAALALLPLLCAGAYLSWRRSRG